ncbi:hypothetical protein PPERSA_00387 [Pseudocohnilembus persalinus]|uniref:Uncharacterized protein n=1 Tax=Pseudocohnilembus persalinus TaxID=266149 RepID=A0A0V0QYF4_PSEPJ|nr:hypothetical protein PPERSA_00387 [Pseudocohnilembus persalinus]|eukprot:KRX07230.1 hypothetical protein PPERSA_00387 [Pseudocohnilembus persalinus]
MDAESSYQGPKKFLLKIYDKTFELKEEFQNISGLAYFSMNQWGFNENGFCEIQLNENEIDLNVLEQIIQWVKDQQYDPPKIQKLTSTAKVATQFYFAHYSNLQEYLNDQGLNQGITHEDEKKIVNEDPWVTKYMSQDQ